MTHKKRDNFSGSVGDGKGRQGLLFQVDEPEAVPLSPATRALLFDPKTQWSLHLGNTPAISMSESLRRAQNGDSYIPVHDVKLLISLPLQVDREQALSIVKELVPDCDESKKKMVFVRQSRWVARPRFAKGQEAAWGKHDIEGRWVNGVSIETNDPADVARFMAAAKQAPKNFKIGISYNEDWFGGVPPKPDERLQRVLDACGIDHDIFQKLSFAEKSSFAHETGLKDYLQSKSAVSGRTNF